MERLSDTAIDIINDLHTERLDYNSEYLPLIDAANKLAEYEDAEEKGLLVHLPCKVGDMVYIADNWKNEVSEFRVNKIGIFAGRKVFYYQKDFEQPITPDLWGKTVFLTPEAAQQALKARDSKMKQGKYKATAKDNLELEDNNSFTAAEKLFAGVIKNEQESSITKHKA